MEADIIDDIDGSIDSLHVRNFFCHDNLEIKFNRNVNFIVGRNGSGKSAILTALVVGLGGRASATNRGLNLSSFIKKGSNSATIEIKIKNNSPRAYRRDHYGDYITIVRNITPTATTYKVKLATGKLISTTYEEVNAIILAHNIQVDNPISVLNQDDARSFYATDAKKKYNLFRKATNLDQTENNYKITIETCEKASKSLQRKNEVFPELEKEYKKWKTYYEQMQSHDEIEQSKQKLQNEYYWSEIAELEDAAAKIQEWLDKQNDYVEKQKREFREMDLNHDKNASDKIVLKKQLEEKLNQKNKLEQTLRLLEQEANEARTSLNAINTSHTRTIDTLKKENQKINDLSQAIQNIQCGSAEAQRVELEARAAAAVEAAEAALARYNTAQHEAEQTRLARVRAVTKEEAAAKNVRRHRDSLANLKQQLRELESNSNDSLAVYGRNMTELCRRIKSMPARHFSAPPIGPIGAYLKVKDSKWGGALEHIIGRSIRSFCVNTPEDSRKLFNIMSEVYGTSSKPSVTCSPFLRQAHDVSRTRVSTRKYGSALDALDISDPVIANFLIDNLGMESILLVPDHDTAIALSHREEKVPQNCSKIVTLDSTEFHPAPNYRSYGGNDRQMQFLHVSIAERKRQLTAEIKEKENQLRVLEAEANQLKCFAQQAREQDAVAAKALQALLVKLHDKKEQERNATEALEQRQDPQFDSLVDDLNASKEKRDRLELQRKDLSAKKEQYTKKINEIDIKMRNVDTEIRSVYAESNEIREEIDRIETRHEQSITKRNMLEHRIREKESKIRDVSVTLAAKQTIISDKINSALKLCARVESPRPLAIVENELNKVSMELRSMQCEGLTRAQVMEKYLQVRRKYEKVKLIIKTLHELITQLNATATNHLKYCLRVQKEIIRRVQHTYQAMLNVRDYSGHLEIRSGAGEVEMFAGRHGSSTNLMSGGERTYSTVAFIMALWQCVELPFYFMDEFDVWMDKVNRKTVIDLLIDHALKNTSRQFVFLTPQDAPTITAGPHIKLHLMEPPRP